MNWKKLYNIILPLIVAAFASMFGYEKVQEYRASQPTPVTNEITFNAPSNSGLDELKRQVEQNRKDIAKAHK